MSGGDLSGDPVQISAALRGQTTSSVGILLDHLQLLQGLERFAGNGTGSGAPMAGNGTVVGTTCKSDKVKFRLTRQRAETCSKNRTLV